MGRQPAVPGILKFRIHKVDFSFVQLLCRSHMILQQHQMQCTHMKNPQHSLVRYISLHVSQSNTRSHKLEMLSPSRNIIDQTLINKDKVIFFQVKQHFYLRFLPNISIIQKKQEKKIGMWAGISQSKPGNASVRAH